MEGAVFIVFLNHRALVNYLHLQVHAIAGIYVMFSQPHSQLHINFLSQTREAQLTFTVVAWLQGKRRFGKKVGGQ